MDPSDAHREMSEDVNNDGNNTILFVFTGLLIGQILKHVSNKTKIPYTPILAVAGVGIGMLYKQTSHWGDGMEYISGIDPHTFFLIFLPPLIFESSFSIDWHIIKVEFFQILILAGPCLVLAAFATALCMRYVLMYDGDFTFEAAVMFGAIISATDPVAVVSVLKELGASRTLSTLIEGESLINDGTAYVMFTVTLDLVKGEKFDALEITGTFCRLSFGGPLLGIVVGMIITFWLKRIVNNSILETNLTIITAYLAFYTAEITDLEVSGILCLVALGLYMTRVGRTKISVASEETLHHIWSYLQYTCETLVFLLAGVIVAVKVVQEDSIIEWQDYVKLIALYAILHVIRLLLILLVGYPITKLGYGLTFKQGLVLGYSGLRGAVSLTLALIVYLDHEIKDEIKDLVIFHTAGIALLTLIINGTTIGMLVKCLGLMRITHVKKKMLKNLIKAYRKEVTDTIVELQEKKNFGKIDWDKLKLLACTEKIRKDIFKKRNIRAEESDLRHSSQMNPDDIVLDNREYTDDELYMEAKHRYYTTLKGIYWDFFEQGKCSSRTVLLLIESADRVIDHLDDKPKDFMFIESYFQASWYMKCLIKLRNFCLFRCCCKDVLYNRVSFVYDVTVNYVEGHEECHELIEQIVHNEEILHKLKHDLRREIKRAENKLFNDLEENFAEVTRAIQHKRGGYFLIHRMRTFVEEMIEHGQIDTREAKFFLHHLNKEEANLQLNKLKIDFEEAEADFETNCALAKIVDQSDLETLYKHFREVQFDSGDVIIKKGSKISELVYISKGIVHERNGDIDDEDAAKIKNRAGDILGLQFITKSEGKSFTNCYAKSVCTCRIFPIEDLLQLIKTREQEIKLWLYMGPSIIYLNPNMFNRLQDLDPLMIKGLLKESKYGRYEKGEKISLESGAILFEGILEEVFQDDENLHDESILSESEKNFDRRRAIIKNYAFIYPNISKYIIKSDACIFELPEQLKDKWLSFNPRVFADALSYLPGMRSQIGVSSIRDQARQTLFKKQKTTLIGIPKGLAHTDPIRTFKEGRRANARERYIQGGIDGPIANDNTILPKGYHRTATRMLTKTPSHDIEKKMTHLKEEEAKVKTKHQKDEFEASSESTSAVLDKLETRQIDVKIKGDQSSDISEEDDSQEDDSQEDSSDENDYTSIINDNYDDEEEEDSTPNDAESQV